MSLATLIPAHDWIFIDGALRILCPECGGKSNSQYGLNREHGTLDFLCYDCGWDGRVELVGWMPPPDTEPSAQRRAA